jgi:hypothetical protein
MLVHRDGQAYRIVKVWPAYTLDVEDAEGNRYRWTGLAGY